MGLFKRNPFGHILFVKKWIIRIFGFISHRRYRGFNELQIEGSEMRPLMFSLVTEVLH